MKVLSSSFGTFYMLEQARQLHRKKCLERFIVSLPMIYAKKEGIPCDKLITPWTGFAIAYVAHRLSSVTSSSFNSRALEYAHNIFSRQLIEYIDTEMDFFIGLSSYCYEALHQLKTRGVKTMVEHASLHEEYERDILLAESSKYGFKLTGNSASQWLIDKEAMEFEEASFISVPSEFAKKTMIDKGVLQDKIIVNPLGVNVSNFIPAKKHDDIFRILFCARLTPRKGLHNLIRAYSELRLSNSELLIVGPKGDLDEDECFKKNIEDHVNEQVRFVGTVSKEGLISHLQQSSVFVLPSLADAFGLVVPGAMSCEIPVIVTSSSGSSELVDDGVTGFIVPPGDIDALKNKILFLYNDKNLTKEMGYKARWSIKQNKLTWDDYGDRLYKFIKSNTSQ